VPRIAQRGTERAEALDLLGAARRDREALDEQIVRLDGGLEFAEIARDRRGVSANNSPIVP
jgi:hypothetical protein